MKNQSTPQGLLRIGSAAEKAGLSVCMFETGIETEAIPVEIIHIGRLKFVRATDLTS